MIDDHYLCYHRCEDKDRLRVQWGEELKTEKDIRSMFVRFIAGQRPGDEYFPRVEVFPWSDERHIAPETSLIADELIRINRMGILTINSQPNVNGLASNDPVHGWGPPDGYVYQKAYLEFFMPTRLLGSMLCILRQYGVRNRSESHSNHADGHPIAVTWGVFPGREIVQPTVVDSRSFLIWRDEAYSIWLKRWGAVYDRHSDSYQLLEKMRNNHLLVNLVDNDFTKSNCLFELIREAFSYEQRSYNCQQVFAV
ncbi:hypothetical protein ACOME3_000652 [Neoechinorhynchus agilis]